MLGFLMKHLSFAPGDDLHPGSGVRSKKTLFHVKNERMSLQGGPLPIISEVISPINGLING